MAPFRDNVFSKLFCFWGGVEGGKRKKGTIAKTRKNTKIKKHWESSISQIKFLHSYIDGKTIGNSHSYVESSRVLAYKVFITSWHPTSIMLCFQLPMVNILAIAYKSHNYISTLLNMDTQMRKCNSNPNWYTTTLSIDYNQLFNISTSHVTGTYYMYRRDHWLCALDLKTMVNTIFAFSFFFFLLLFVYSVIQLYFVLSSCRFF